MKKHTLVVTLFVILIGAGVFVWYFDRTVLQRGGDDVARTAEPSAEVKKEMQGGVIEQEGDLRRYVHERLGFSFASEQAFSVTTVPDVSGETILVRGEGAREEFQIYVMPYDEPAPITPERIREDLPGLVIKEPKRVLIGEEQNTEALIFYGESEDFGETREVWFIEDEQLYQVITYADQDAFIGPILETLRFETE